ncbi:MAG: hypothetical protein QM809_15200 [Gordonia sp. (in: high G+C Gram-positive bacteria)]|uniref:hypothetical protein n=1 Tax=Gordonia sp. (in: high G+C Gram-positive bacteria) TaxID=84139 RepID=UPI0039E48E03
MGAQQWVTLTVGLVASIGVIATLWQRQRSEHLDRVELRRDRARRDEYEARSEWWRRWQWAVEMALADDDARERTGIETLDALVMSSLVTGSELDIVEMYFKNRGGPSRGSH